MRILQVLWSGDIGGSERHVSELLRGLSPKHDCAVCFLTHPGTMGDILNKMGIPWFALGMRNGLDFFCLLKIRKPLHTGRYDMIHEHSGNKLAIYAYRFFSPKAKTVFTIHNGEPISAFSFLRLRGEIAKLKCFHKIIAVSQPVADMWMARAKGIPITVIPNGIEVPDNKRRILRKVDDPVSLITVGRLIPSKRMHLLIDLLGPMLQAHQCILQIVGDGPERTSLEKRIQEMGWSSCIQLLGTQTDLQPLFEKASLFVFTSAYESFGLAIAEAAAAGLPCVAANSNYLSQVIRDRETGFLIPEEQLHSHFAQVVFDLVAHPKLIQELGDNARKYIDANYSLHTMLLQVENLYLQLLEAS